MKLCLSLFLISCFSCFSQTEIKLNAAAKELQYKIFRAALCSLNEKDFDQKELNEIVCITNLSSKKWDGTYLGAFYYPTKEEIEIWKKWLDVNKDLISYSSLKAENDKRKIIQVEYEKGKFRNTNCP